MKTKEQRLNELYSSGLVDTIKGLFAGKNVNIDEDYYALMADYIDSLDEVKDSMILNPVEILNNLPNLVSNIQETNLNGIYGITDENGIRINKALDYESKKLYFFHELTHAVQTKYINEQEHCGFYNGHDGMFLTEGATQYTAEILYHVSNGTNINYREQPATVRGDSTRTPYSPLSEYQYNGNMLMLLCKTMDLPLPQVLSLGYKKNGRETLKSIYESMEGNQGKFDELMNDFEQIYSIDKLLMYGFDQQLQSQKPINIIMQDGTQFEGNINTYKMLMDKVERNLMSTFFKNHDTEYILQNHSEFEKYLTTPNLKTQFLSAVHELEELSHGNNLTTNDNVMKLSDFLEEKNTVPEIPKIPEFEMSNDFTINEFGEIIRPSKGESEFQKEDKTLNTNSTPLTLRQKIAQFFRKNTMLMKLPFIEKFVNKQLNILPLATQDIKAENNNNSLRENFVNWLSNNGEFRNLPPVQSISDSEKIAKMQKEMNQYQQKNTNDDERI